MSSIRQPFLLTLLMAASLAAAEPGSEPGSEPLDRDSLVYLVSGNTAECRKEKDQSLCTNYFSEEGELTQILREDGERKEGVWFVDDTDRLCILWTGKIKPLCFHVYEQPDHSYKMIRHEKHITTILSIDEGNPQNL